MKTIEDRTKQAQCEIDAALAKRNRAYQMIDEAEEEIIQARMKLADIEKERKKK